MPYTPKNTKIFRRIPKNQDEFTFTYSERVFNACTSVKEGTAKLIQKVCYFREMNKRDGIHEVLISPHVLARQLKRSVKSLFRYLNEATRAGFIIWEKVKDECFKLRYRLTPTESLLNLLGAAGEKPKSVHDMGQSVHDMGQSVHSKNLCEAQETADDKPVFDPLYSNIYNYISLNSLNDKPFQSEIEECKQPTAPSSPTSSSTNTSLRGENVIEPTLFIHTEVSEASIESQSLVEEALQCVEGINAKLETPFRINESQFAEDFERLMCTDIGPGREGIERFHRYCMDWANNDCLMGRKTLADGKTFVTHMGTILSGKFFQMWWNGEGFFKVYAPSKPNVVKETKEEEQISTPTPIYFESQYTEMNCVPDTPFKRDIDASMFSDLANELKGLSKQGKEVPKDKIVSFTNSILKKPSYLSLLKNVTV